MSTRYLIALAAAASLVFACGPRGPQTAESASAQQEQPRRHRRSPGEPTVVPVLRVRVAEAGRDVALALRLENTTDRKVDLIFPSGRTHDFVVLDSVGREVWRWSDARMFTGALQNRTIGAGAAITFEEHWERPASAHGRFTVVAVVASDNFPLEQRADFTLP